MTIAVHAFGQNAQEALVADLRHGLRQVPKTIPPRWFYDDRGSELFEAITELPEYYQTRTEAAILRARAAEIVGAAAPESIVELGAGASTKSRILLAAAVPRGLRCFVPFDISQGILARAAHQIVEEFPGLNVYALVGDFAGHMSEIPRFGRQMVVFLGSTIGNFDPADRAAFLAQVRGMLADGDSFLLGVDLVKDRDELVRAYDDAAGVTAEFNLNLLAMVNRELQADFDLHAFRHVALWNDAEFRIEMHLRSLRDQRVAIPGAGLEVDFAAGETVRTEISGKYTRASVEAAFAEAGLRLDAWYTDDHSRFALALARPV
ncbi:MAG TPA: L-histidine N(alpha)-methyltransferase [Candidatus Dormibacteraeota bacterium]|nr:L-histidine N(alpha)-methyltransferase [Candidatus Dormibacteraeota bacterium]